MPTALTLFKNVLRKLTIAEVDANFEALQANVDKLGGYTASQTPGATQIPVTKADQSITFPGTVVLGNGQINFPATQNPSSGQNTLDDYEEGTWTPGKGSLVVSGTFSSSGSYTKIGRQVTLRGRVAGSISISAAAASYIAGAPFVPASEYFAGSAFNGEGNAIIGILGGGSSTMLYTSGFAATAALDFTITYFV